MDINDSKERAKLFSVETVHLLAKGLIQLYQPSLTGTKQQLTELTSKQNALVEQMHNENLEISRVKHSPELMSIFNNLKTYQEKLINIKKDMKLLHDRSSRIKKRALKLQQFVEKEAYIRNQKKEMQLRMEQELIANAAKPI